MSKYTIVGVRPSQDWGHGLYQGSFVAFAEAETPAQAASIVRHRMADSEDGREAGDFCILAVFRGHLDDEYDASADTDEA